MVHRALLVVALIVLVGCSRATLPYKPEPQPQGARISAGYQSVGDRIRIEINTGGRPLEQVWILKPDGSSLGPQDVEAPAVAANAGPSISFGRDSGAAAVAALREADRDPSNNVHRRRPSARVREGADDDVRDTR